MDFSDARRITTGCYDWRNKHVLVTGGAGFVGSYLVEDLVIAGARVRVADDLSTGSLGLIKQVLKDVEFLQLDLTNHLHAEQAVKGCDAVFHLAAKAYGMLFSMSHNFEVLRDNVTMAFNVLDACIAANVERTLIVSSSCIYDDNARIPTPELPVEQGRPESVNEGYGWAKRIIEIQSRYANAEFGLPVALVRPFNAYGGRYQWQGEASHVVPSLVKRVFDRSDPVVVWGTGQQVRDLLHARDFALGFRLLAEKVTDCDVVNLAGGHSLRLVDLVKKLAQMAEYEPRIEFDQGKLEGRPRKEAELTKLRQVLPEFRPTVSLEDGLADMVQWYQRNRAVGTF